MIPSVFAWYKLAKEAVNHDDYALAELRDTRTPDLDNLVYLEPKLRDAWQKNQDKLKADAAEKSKLAKKRMERQKQMIKERARR